MCKIRLVHFSAHDVRVPMATSLFSVPSSASNGDFTCPTRFRACRCRSQVGELLKQDENRPPHCPPFEVCPWHDCCVNWYQVASRCDWYWDNREQMELDGELEIETVCPHSYILCEYMPLSMVLDMDRMSEADGASVWEPRDWAMELPRFPAGDLLYSNEFANEHTQGDDESWQLSEDRVRLEQYGERLGADKNYLNTILNIASGYLYRSERDLRTAIGVRVLAHNPLFWLESVSQQVQQARSVELAVAKSYLRLMDHMKSVLTRLNKMPPPGESVTSPDGSFSISREQLDMAGLDPADVIAACDGPLKQAGKLMERLQAIKDDLQRLKKRNTRTVRHGPKITLRKGTTYGVRRRS